MSNPNEWTAEERAYREAACANFNRYLGLDVLAATLNIRPLNEPVVYDLLPVCRCGLNIMEAFGIADALGRFEAYRCPQCFRLVMVSKGTGQQMWYTKETI